MRQSAALKIDHGIAKVEAPVQDTATFSANRMWITFQPYKGLRRKPGTGCLSQINDHLQEGRYPPVWPDGKKRPRNVYAKTRDECERLLAEMIEQVKAEIASEKKRLKQEGKAG